MDQEGTDSLDGEAKKRLRHMSRELALSPIWHDWSGRGTDSHVDYPSEDPLPLEFEETLGKGASGVVEKIVCHNISLAVKTKTVRLGQPREWKEIDVLKKLSHRHIIKFVGTFNHKQVMGLVLWPVAVCDLATFFRDLDIFKNNETLRSFSKTEPIYHFKELGIKVESCALAKPLAREWLYQKFGCLASAIYYIHRNGIRHKDLKPSNILLTSSGIRLTDFGTSTDFSDRPSSESNNGERGTHIYFAPEVAAHQVSGRPADIFMLGCVFLEICWSICMPKKTMKDLAIVRRGPFQANLSTVRRQCLDCIEDASADPHVTTLQHLLLLIREMLDPDPTKRPNALKIKSQLVYFDGCRKKDNEKGDSEWSFHGRCCQPVQIGTKPITKAGINDLKKFMDERGQPVALLSIPNDHPANVVAAQPSSALPPQVHKDSPSEKQPEDTSYDASSQTSTSEDTSIMGQAKPEPDSDDDGSHAEAEKTVLLPKRQPSEVPSLMDSGIPHGNPDFYFDPRTLTCPANESSAVPPRVPSPVFGLEAPPGAAAPGIRTEVVRGSAFVGVHYGLDFQLKKAASPNQLSAPPLNVESHMRDDLIQLDDFVSSSRQDNLQGVASQKATVSPQTVISQQGALPPQEQSAAPPLHDTSEPMSLRQTASSKNPFLTARPPQPELLPSK
jgi:serine/threonine protein kinase